MRVTTWLNEYELTFFSDRGSRKTIPLTPLNAELLNYTSVFYAFVLWLCTLMRQQNCDPGDPSFPTLFPMLRKERELFLLRRASSRWCFSDIVVRLVDLSYSCLRQLGSEKKQPSAPSLLRSVCIQMVIWNVILLFFGFALWYETFSNCQDKYSYILWGGWIFIFFLRYPSYFVKLPGCWGSLFTAPLLNVLTGLLIPFSLSKFCFK